MDTVELKIDITPREPWSEILIAELAENGFDSFVNTETGILAYAQATIDVDEAIKATIVNSKEEVTFNIQQTIIPYQNWNAQWEENFQPVFIEQYASILAPFHNCEDAKGIVAIIQPQMSFGTGHHQTTWMMTKALFELESIPKSVLDMGSGTGVLAIFASKLGAKNVLAVDIEEWSTQNCVENVERNSCSNVKCVCGDIDVIQNENFGLILANINKNVLKAHMIHYARALVNSGKLVLSGFFNTDVKEIVQNAEESGLQFLKQYKKDEWACVIMQKLN